MMTVQKVRDWMSSRVTTVTPDTSIGEAHEIMKSNNIRRLPVLEGGRIVGIVTIGDVREASPSDATSLSIWELNYLWDKLTIGQIMTRDPVVVTAEDSVVEATRRMLEYKVGGLPVVDENNRPVGIITESDIFKMLVKTQV